MRAIETNLTNLTLKASKGQEDVIGELPAIRGAHTIATVWELDEDDLKMVREGGVVFLEIYGNQPHPPVRLSVKPMGQQIIIPPGVNKN